MVMRTIATLSFNLLNGVQTVQTVFIAGSFFFSLWSFIRWVGRWHAAEFLCNRQARGKLG